MSGAGAAGTLRWRPAAQARPLRRPPPALHVAAWLLAMLAWHAAPPPDAPATLPPRSGQAPGQHPPRLAAPAAFAAAAQVVPAASAAAAAAAGGPPSSARFPHHDPLAYILAAVGEALASPGAANVSFPCYQRFGWLYVQEQRLARARLCTPPGDDGPVLPPPELTAPRPKLSKSAKPAPAAPPVTPDAPWLSPLYRPRASDRGGPGPEPPPWARTAASATASAAHRPDLSSVDCYLQPNQHGTPGPRGGQTLCLIRNMVLDSCDFMRQPFRHRFPAPGRGSVRLACEWQDRALALVGPKNTMNRAWLVEAPKAGAYEDVKSSCSGPGAKVVDHPVLLVMRDRAANVAHDLELASMAFSGLAALDLPEVRSRGMQVVVSDFVLSSPYMETWRRISSPHPLRFLATDPYPPGTCFRTAILLYSYYSGLSLNPDPRYAACPSPLLSAMHRWYRGMFPEIDPGALAAEGRAQPTSGVMRRSVVWLSRRSTDAIRLGVGRLSKWERSRIITNDDAVVSELHRAVSEWNARSCLLATFDAAAPHVDVSPPPKSKAQQQPPPAPAPGSSGGVLVSGVSAKAALQPYGDMSGCRRVDLLFDLLNVDFADVPFFPAQLSTVFNAGVLIGVHGAAMVHMLLAPPGAAALVQLVSADWAHSHHPNDYKTCAYALGNGYYEGVYEGRAVNATLAVELLWRAMDDVAARIAAQHNGSYVAVRPYVGMSETMEAPPCNPKGSLA